MTRSKAAIFTVVTVLALWIGLNAQETTPVSTAIQPGASTNAILLVNGNGTNTTFRSSATTTIPLTVQALASQATNLVELQSSASAILFSVSQIGVVNVPISLNSRTNIGAFDVTITDMVVGTRYTNSARRAFVAASVQLSAAAAGTAKATLFVEHGTTITNKLSISAGPLASLITVEPLCLPISPSAVYYITDETSGVGASIAVVSGTCSLTAQ